MPTVRFKFRLKCDLNCRLQDPRVRNTRVSCAKCARSFTLHDDQGGKQDDAGAGGNPRPCRIAHFGFPYRLFGASIDGAQGVRWERSAIQTSGRQGRGSFKTLACGCKNVMMSDDVPHETVMRPLAGCCGTHAVPGFRHGPYGATIFLRRAPSLHRSQGHVLRAASSAWRSRPKRA